MEMKAKATHAGYDMYFRAKATKSHKKTAGKKHRTVRAHTRMVRGARLFDIPDEQMSEPPVVPKEERRYWH
jgi:hypothetical protein